MRVLVQWTQADPGDWVEVDHSDWASLPFKDVTQTVDNSPGHVTALNVQGIVITGYDHYSVESVVDPELGDGVRVTSWQDDPEDFPEGTRYATVWELFEPAPDPTFDGALNTRQRRFVYAEPRVEYLQVTHSWDEFTAPHPSLHRHGVWVSDESFAAHVRAVSHRGWREWISGG